MIDTEARRFWEPLLAAADIKLGGSRSWDIRVHSDRFFRRLIRQGELGVGDSYTDGDWDCDRLDLLIAKTASVKLRELIPKGWRARFAGLVSLLRNPNPRRKAFEIGQKHYDIGNDLYTAMLDPRMTYTCGYWRGLDHAAENLGKAQEAKLALICRKLDLKPGMRVLDIGGGWGSLARYAAEKHGVSVVNVTVSKEQVALADRLCAGLPVVNRLQDYREVNERFDRVVSIGMFEHVGVKNYRAYMEVARRCLAPGGRFLLHSIVQNLAAPTNLWTTTHVFPNSELPALSQIAKAAEGLFVMEDWHNIGPNYDPTLMAWWHNFEAAWPRLRDKYGERFYRMWKLYLQGSAGSFRSRALQVWQVLLTREGIPGGFEAARG